MNFEKQFNRIKPTIKVFAKRFSKATSIPIEEYESAMCEEFSKKYERYDGRISFDAYIKPILHQCAQRVATRKERKFYDNVVHVDGDAAFEFADKTTAEKLALENIEKSPDKRELVRALIENADEFTIAVVNNFLKNPGATCNSIATEMGVHPTKVSRKIKRLARYYDSSRFGELSQYLAV